MGSLTANLGLTVPTVGGDAGPAFANEINGDLSILDSVLGGVNTINVGGSSNVTANTAQSQNLVQNLIGTLSGNITYFLPATGRFYCIQNNTTGGFLLAVGCTGGLNTLSIPQGLSVFVWSDGQTVRISNPPGWTEISNTALNGAASVNLALPSPFRRFRLTGQGITGTNGGNVALQASTDGGASFVSSGYSFVQTRSSNDIAAAVPAITTSVGAAASISLTGGFRGPGSGWSDFTYEIYPGVSPNSFVIRGDQFSLNSAAALVTLYISGQVASFGVNTIGIFTPIGTFSGTLILEGLP